DLKPANVVLDPSGIAKLTDFGIARAARDPAEQELLGTARYIAPERVEGGAVTARTDVYGLGLLAYELLAGQPAFDGGSDAELVRKRLLGPPPSLRHRRLGVDGRADTVISRALALAPERRYASAGAFARAFAGASDSGGDHTSVLAAAPVPRALRRLNLPRLDSAVALLALLAILLATVLFFASFPKGLPAVGQPAASAGAPAHTTPNVVGQRLSSGVDALLAAGYKGVRWDVAQGSGGAACAVARQDPALRRCRRRHPSLARRPSARPCSRPRAARRPHSRGVVRRRSAWCAPAPRPMRRADRQQEAPSGRTRRRAPSPGGSRAARAGRPRCRDAEDSADAARAGPVLPQGPRCDRRRCRTPRRRLERT